MNDLEELYQELILDHGRNPRNHRALEDCNRAECTKADGANPLCGDRLTVYLKLSDGRVDDLSFVGSGCAIFTASASMMTESLRGKTEEEAKALLGAFLHTLTDESGSPPPEELGKLAALTGVREFPMRVKCASLAWRTVEAAFGNNANTASTE